MRGRLTLVAVLAGLVTLPPTLASVGAQQRERPATDTSVYVPADIVGRMLEIADVTSTDIVYDLGCRDGRLAIAAARMYGARAVGVDSDPARIALATANAEKEGVSHLVQFIAADTIDFSEATVVTLGMPQSAPWLSHNGLVSELLDGQLEAGSRVVSTFLPGSMDVWKPTLVDGFPDASGEPRAKLYLWDYDGAPPR